MKQRGKFFGILAASAAIFLLGAGVANADYRGQWEWDDSGPQESLILGDRTDGTGLYLAGTSSYCVRPGDSYATMHQVLEDNGHNGQPITWWIDQSCSDRYDDTAYVRVCVENRYNESACSTYENDGWDDYGD